MEHNHKGKSIPVDTWVRYIASDSTFRQGWLDAAAGKEWCDCDNANYERGRHFYFWYQQQNYPRATWRRGVMARTVQNRLKTAAYQRAII